jgi:hypothetical protein
MARPGRGIHVVRHHAGTGAAANTAFPCSRWASRLRP